jgi:cell division septation protein DedD
MPRTDEGQYELVLGNRQLVSGFFVLIILFAVFLTLGYVLGRNSLAKEDKTSARSTGAVSAPIASPVEEPAAPTRPTGSSTRPSPSAGATASSSAPAAVVEEQAVTETRQTAAEPEPSPVPQTKAQQILSSKVRVITPRKGDTFIQVAAIGRAEAELMAEQLQKNGFRTFISEVPGRDLFRVLIGPFETTAKLNETRKKLEGQGISSIVQRY